MDVRFCDRRAEIYTYDSENIVYGLSWSVRPISFPLLGHYADAWKRLHVLMRSCSCGNFYKGADPMHERDSVFMGWVQNRDKNRFRLAVGSFIEDHNNYVEIIECACHVLLHSLFLQHSLHASCCPGACPARLAPNSR